MLTCVPSPSPARARPGSPPTPRSSGSRRSTARPASPRPSPAPTARPRRSPPRPGGFTTPERVGYHVAPDLARPRPATGEPSGFQARHSLVVRCPDIDAAGGLLTALADAVGDRLEIEGVSLEVADQSAALVAAREAAYADAVDRATHLAGLAGAELGDVQDGRRGRWRRLARRPRWPRR